MLVLSFQCVLCARVWGFLHTTIKLVSDTSWYPIIQINKKPRNKPMNLWSPNLWQRRQEYTMEKDSLFNKWCWEHWAATCKRVKLKHSVAPYTKINLNKHQNGKLDTINVPEANVGRTLFDINHSDIFFQSTS